MNGTVPAERRGACCFLLGILLGQLGGFRRTSPIPLCSCRTRGNKKIKQKEAGSGALRCVGDKKENFCFS